MSDQEKIAQLQALLVQLQQVCDSIINTSHATNPLDIVGRREALRKYEKVKEAISEAQSH